MTKRWNIAAGVLIAILVLPLLLFYGGFSVAAPSKQSAAREIWSKIGFSFDGVAERYPKTSKNEAAVLVETFAAKIGVYDPKTVGTPLLPFLKEYLESEAYLASTDTLPPLPPQLETLSTRHAADFDAFCEEFLAGPVPVWDSDVTMYAEAPIPDLALGRAVASALASDAVYRLLKQDQAGALRACRAIQKLGAAYRARPELVSQMIANVLDIRLAQIARKLPSAPPEFTDGLVDPNFREKFYIALGMESWAVNGVVEQSAATGGIAFSSKDPPGIFERVIGAVARPYFRYCVAENSEVLAETALKVKNQWPDEVLISNPDSGMEERFSGWNVLAMALPSLGSTNKSYGEAAMHLEITQMILRAKESRRNNAGPSRTPSAVLPGESWAFTPAETPGQFSLSFTQPEKFIDSESLAAWGKIDWK